MTHRIRKGLHKKNKEPAVTISRIETMRQYITALLEQETLSARDISQLMVSPKMMSAIILDTSRDARQTQSAIDNNTGAM
jgi:hypothetical protein